MKIAHGADAQPYRKEQADAHVLDAVGGTVVDGNRIEGEERQQEEVVVPSDPVGHHQRTSTTDREEYDV